MKFEKKKILITTIMVLLLPLVFSCSTTNNNKNLTEKKNYLKESNFAYIDTNEIKSIARGYVVKGSTMQQTGNHYGAIVEFYDALELDSSNSISYALAKSYYEIGKFEKSKRLLINVIKKDKDFYVAYTLLADIYLILEDLDNAILTYQDLVQISQKTEYYYSLANLYEYSNPNKSIEIYEYLLNQKNNQTVLPKLLSLYITTEQAEKYESILKKLLTNYPGSSEYNYRLSEIYIDRKDYNNLFVLMENFDKNSGYEDKAAYFSYISYYLIENEIQNVELIERFYPIIQNKFQFDENLLLYSGIFAYTLNDTANSQKYFQRLLKITSEPSKKIISMAYYFISNNDSEIALEYLNQDTTENWDKYHCLGLTYQMRNDTIKAISSFKKAVEIDSSQPESWLSLGILYSFTNEIEKSDLSYIKALSLDPDNPLANNNYAYSLSERGKNLPQALSMSEHSLKFDSLNSSYLDTYGWILYKMGKYENALKFMNKAVEYSEESAEVHEHLGDVLIMLNKKTEAIQAWKKSMEIDEKRYYLNERILKYEDK